jgi:NAD(P)H-hydrate epimerase
MRVSTVGEMRRLDQGAIEEFGVPDLLLMENAGEAVYYEIVQSLSIDGRRFTVIGGPGNNGGDSFVVARKLRSSGAQVRVLIFAEVDRFSGPVQLNYEMIYRSGVRILVDPTSDEVVASLRWCDVVVDGLLGTGLTREVEGRFREVIEQVNSAGKQVVSVDIPSGVDGDTGQVRGVAIRADTTVTFGLPKRGNLLPPGAALNGRLVVTHISFPPKLLDESGILVSVTEPSRLPAGPIAHRDSASEEVLCIGGSRDSFEAPGLAALAILRVGRGKVRLAVPESITSALAELDREIVLAPQAETPSGSLALSTLEGLLSLGRDADFVVLGPGLSSEPETRELVRRLVGGLEHPLLIAGDGATVVAAAPEVLRGRPGGTVLLLPHDELSRITITSPPTSDREGDPIPPLQDVAEALGIIPVLQGNPALIGFPDRRVELNLSGASVPALAGSSELMAGTIAAMYSLGLPLEEAVKTGVFLLGFAGDSAVRGRDPGEIDNRTLLERLPVAAEALGDHYDDIRAQGPGTIEVI